MTNVIRFPNSRTVRTIDVERRNDVRILFFTGVRYMRDEGLDDGLASVAALSADSPGAVRREGEAELGTAERMQA